MRIVTGTITNGITLAAGDNPVLIAGVVTYDSTSKLTSAVYAGAGVYAEVTNGGTVGDISHTDKGVYLAGGGRIANGSPILTDAVIQGVDEAVRLGGMSAVSNYGSIGGTLIGVQFEKGGKITNGSAFDATAVISAFESEAIYFGAAGTVVNYGSLESGLFGVDLAAGGWVTNGSSTAAQGLITGRAGGIESQTGTATIRNFGTIKSTGANSSGVGGALLRVTNGSSTSTTASISASFGVDGAEGAVANFGTITGVGINGEAIFLGRGSTVVNGSPASTAAHLDGHLSGSISSALGRSRITRRSKAAWWASC
jgi:hypothetical protein